MSIEDAADFHFLRAYDLYGEDRYRESLAHVEAALEIEPRHIQALILGGETHLLDYESIGLEPEKAYNKALNYFDRALSVEPRHAEAWACKGLALIYLERPMEALEAAEKGLAVLELQIGWAMSDSDFFTNISEALHDRKIRALLELERTEDARKALSEGLAYCPGSKYLTRLVDEFFPEMQDR